MNFLTILKSAVLALLSMSVTVHGNEQHLIKVKNSYKVHPKKLKILFLMEDGQEMRSSSRGTYIELGQQAKVVAPNAQEVTAAVSVVRGDDQEILLGSICVLSQTTASIFFSSENGNSFVHDYVFEDDGIKLNVLGSYDNWGEFELKHLTVVNAYQVHPKKIKIEFLGRNREKIGNPSSRTYGEHADVIIPPEHVTAENDITVVVFEKKQDGEEIQLGLFRPFNHLGESADVSFVTIENVKVKKLEHKYDLRDNEIVFYQGARQLVWGKLKQENDK